MTEVKFVHSQIGNIVVCAYDDRLIIYVDGTSYMTDNPALDPPHAKERKTVLFDSDKESPRALLKKIRKQTGLKNAGTGSH